MAQPQKQLLHVNPAVLHPSVVYHPSVLFCTENAPYSPNKHYPGKTMAVHSRLQNVGGNIWKCLNCNTQDVSQ